MINKLKISICHIYKYFVILIKKKFDFDLFTKHLLAGCAIFTLILLSNVIIKSKTIRLIIMPLSAIYRLFIRYLEAYRYLPVGADRLLREIRVFVPLLYAFRLILLKTQPDIAMSLAFCRTEPSW